jgi:hypothetical protein
MSEEDVLREIVRQLARRKSRSEMVGEFLREVSLLGVVFAPLDMLFNPGAASGWVIAAAISVASVLGYVGMRIEESRR